LFINRFDCKGIHGFAMHGSALHLNSAFQVWLDLKGERSAHSGLHHLSGQARPERRTLGSSLRLCL